MLGSQSQFLVKLSGKASVRGHVGRLEGGESVSILERGYKGGRCLACLRICKEAQVGKAQSAAVDMVRTMRLDCMRAMMQVQGPWEALNMSDVIWLVLQGSQSLLFGEGLERSQGGRREKCDEAVVGTQGEG